MFNDELANNFCGYVELEGDTSKSMFFCNVNGHIASFMPPYEKANNINMGEIHSYIEKNDVKYIYGREASGQIFVLQRGELSYDTCGNGISYLVPIIITSRGCDSSLYYCKYFTSISFHGGNINNIYNPKVVVATKMCSEHEQYVDVIIDNENVKLVYGICEYKDKDFNSLSLGNVESFIRLEFKESKHFDKIERYYDIVKNLLTFLTGHHNLHFDVTLQQHLKCLVIDENMVCIPENYSNNTVVNIGKCRMNYTYTNYCNRSYEYMISIDAIKKGLPKLIEIICEDGLTPLMDIFISDNNSRYLTIDNVRNLVVALEAAYNKHEDTDKNKREEPIIKLKKEIKHTIRKFKEEEKFDANKLTDISKAFEHFSFTIKDKIYFLYCKYQSIINSILIANLSKDDTITNLNIEDIKKFVDIRHSKSHGSITILGNEIKFFAPLFILVHICLFERIKCLDIIEKSGFSLLQ